MVSSCARTAYLRQDLSQFRHVCRNGFESEERVLPLAPRRYGVDHTRVEEPEEAGERLLAAHLSEEFAQCEALGESADPCQSMIGFDDAFLAPDGTGRRGQLRLQHEPVGLLRTPGAYRRCPVLDEVCSLPCAGDVFQRHVGRGRGNPALGAAEPWAPACPTAVSPENGLVFADVRDT